MTEPGIVLTNGEAPPPGLVVSTRADGEFVRAALTNDTGRPWQVRQVVLHDIAHGLPPDTPFYGDSFNMFGGTVGTLAAMKDLDDLSDRGHYRMPEDPGMRAVYGVAELTPPGGPTHLFAFTSCRRFIGRINVSDERIQVVADTENLTIAPGERWDLEEMMVSTAADRNDQRKQLAGRLNANHPRLPWPKLPTGWCSWYCFGPDVTAKNVRDNLEAFTRHFPGGVRYIQIDDGYQTWMGDWLDPNERFPGGAQRITRQITDAGFEAAIWVAPFVASPESRLFREHSDWFVMDNDGKPLRSDKVTFGGWRQGPWYMLDGTHPGAQGYLEHVFRTMRQKWGVTYFKLDANIWGSLPFGRRHDPQATCVEAYRRGMAAVRRGAGSESLILGCNHALWPSLGEIHASRVSFDIGRSWGSYKRIAAECLWRNWMNDQLWWNDPDCLLIADVRTQGEGFILAKPRDGEKPSPVTADEFSFHAAATVASGGMLLSGDDVTTYSADQWQLLRRSLEREPLAATFESDALDVGIMDEPGRRLVVLLNWDDAPAVRRVPLGRRFAGRAVVVSDFWSGQSLGIHTTDPEFALPPRSGRLVMLHEEL